MKIVAEVAQAHDGSLGTALAYVKAIAASGADAAKFQCHDGDTCNKFRNGTWFPQDVTRQAYWARVGFTAAEWSDISECCHDHGIEFICSPFSMEAFDKMETLVDRWKIASSKVKDYELIDACVKTEKPVILSNGMSEWESVAAFAELVDHIPHDQCTLLQCTSLYPTPAEAVQLYAKEPYLCKGRGISDHSATIWPSICAAHAGFDMAEVHVVFSRECFGPDVTSSITTAELKQLVDGVRFIERMGKHGRDVIKAELKEMREVFNVA